MFVLVTTNRRTKAICLLSTKRKKGNAPVFPHLEPGQSVAAGDYGCRQHPTWQDRQEIDYSLMNGKKLIGNAHFSKKQFSKGFAITEMLTRPPKDMMKINPDIGSIQEKSFLLRSNSSARRQSKSFGKIGRKTFASTAAGGKFINRALIIKHVFSAVEPPLGDHAEKINTSSPGTPFEFSFQIY